MRCRWIHLTWMVLWFSADLARAGTAYWTGAADIQWANSANWTNSQGEAVLPGPGTNVVIDASGNQPTLNLDAGTVTIASLNIGASNASTLTFMNGNVTDKRLLVTGNVIIGPLGILTHSANASAPTHRLFLDVGGNLTVASGGKIDVTGRGYAAGQGPGVGGANVAGSHGGRGAPYQNSGAYRPLGTTYGSITAPVTLGSGGRGYNPTSGGGAIRLVVVGHSLVNGTIIAQGGTHHQPGAGGSVYLTTGTLEMDGGSITANGGNGTGDADGAGGGRVAIILTAQDADFSSLTAATITTYGGYAVSANAPGAAGTVYMQTHAQGAGGGTLIVDNNRVTHAEVTTMISTNTTDTSVGDVLLRDKARLEIQTPQTLRVYGSWSNGVPVNPVAGSGQLVLAGAQTATVYGSTTLSNLVCTNGGKIVRFQTNTTQTVTAGLTLAGQEGNLLTLEPNAGDPAAVWSLNAAPGSVQLEVAYLAVSNSVASGETIATLGSQDKGGNVNWIFSDIGHIIWTGGAGNSQWNAIDNWNFGRLPLAHDLSITIPTPVGNPPQPVLDGDRMYYGDLIIATGAELDLNGRNLIIDGDVSVVGTLRAQGSEVFTCGSNLSLTGVLESAQGIVRLTGNAAQILTADGNAFHQLDLATTQTVTVADSFSARYLTFPDANVNAVFLGGFTADTLRLQATSNATLTFTAGQTYRINEDFFVYGAPGNPVVLTAAGAWYLDLDGGHVARYVDVTHSDASGGRTIYAFDSVGANTVNWNFDDGKLWIGADTDWSQAGNWSPAGVPTAASHVLLDGTGTGVPVLTADTSLVGLTVLNGSGPASLTVDMPFAGTDRLRISDSLYIGDAGNLTHSANNGTHRLAIDVDGNLMVATGGKIDVTGKGYGAGQGPGAGASGTAGSHGGCGAPYQNSTAYRPLGATYGSITAPVKLGSGGNGYYPTRGAGAIQLLVAGQSTVNGTVTAQGGSHHMPGAGGSIFMTTGSLRMTGGIISANGGNSIDVGGTGNACGAGGGRIAIVLTAEDADFSNVIASTISAYGGYAVYANAPGAAGSVYLQTQAQGESRGTLSVDNNRTTHADVTTMIGPLVIDTTVGDVMLKNQARFAVTNQTLWVHGNWSNAAAFASATNGTVVLAGNDPATVWGANTWGNLTITNRYKQVAFEAGREQTILGTPRFDAIVYLQSTVPGVQWHIRAPGDPEIDPPQLVGAVIVRDSDASSGRAFKARAGSDQGNNLNWLFSPKGTMFLMR